LGIGLNRLEVKMARVLVNHFTHRDRHANDLLHLLGMKHRARVIAADLNLGDSRRTRGTGGRLCSRRGPATLAAQENSIRSTTARHLRLIKPPSNSADNAELDPLLGRAEAELLRGGSPDQTTQWASTEFSCADSELFEFKTHGRLVLLDRQAFWQGCRHFSIVRAMLFQVIHYISSNP
jgi:hypothetical protein